MTDIATGERIQLKAKELFLQYGFRSVSMDDIANNLGISKKTIYQFYSDKDDLVVAVVDNQIEFSEDCCLKDKSEAKDAIHEIFLAMEMMEEMFANMNPSVLFDMEKFHPKAFAKFQQHKYNFLYKVFTENIQRGKEEELFREDIDTDIMVKTRLEMIMLPFNQHVFPKNKFRLADVQMQLTEFYLFGIATQKGHKLIQKYQQERIKLTADAKK
jgi:TetR/AcrR family transcriptional regulator, cholesterol catabolism regulator